MEFSGSEVLDLGAGNRSECMVYGTEFRDSGFGVRGLWFVVARVGVASVVVVFCCRRRHRWLSLVVLYS